MKEDYINNITLSNYNSLDIFDASIEILEKMKFLDKDSHNYKFKIIANQVVVETPEYYYKIYIDYGDQGKYLLEIRRKLAEIYESYGVHWKILYSYCDNRVITIEQREKLKLCDYDITCKQLLLIWKKTIDKLVTLLKFNDILLQLKEKSGIPELLEVDKILILKESLIKPEDYAYAPNGNVILLDDTDFFLVLAKNNGELVSIKNLNLDIMTTCGKMSFCSQNEHWEERINGDYGISKRFFIFDRNYKIQNIDVFVPNDKDTLNKQLRAFSIGKVSGAKYKNEYYYEYINKHLNKIDDDKKNKLV